MERHAAGADAAIGPLGSRRPLATAPGGRNRGNRSALRSGTAHHPDARWRVAPGTIARAARRQRALLAAAAPVVKRGGLLIYATCSLEPEENSDIVNEFLARHPTFARKPAPDAVLPALLTVDGDFQTLPQRHAVDGAYAARLVRTR